MADHCIAALQNDRWAQRTFDAAANCEDYSVIIVESMSASSAYALSTLVKFPQEDAISRHIRSQRSFLGASLDEICKQMERSCRCPHELFSIIHKAITSICQSLAYLTVTEYLITHVDNHHTSLARHLPTLCTRYFAGSLIDAAGHLQVFTAIRRSRI